MGRLVARLRIFLSTYVNIKFYLFFSVHCSLYLVVTIIEHLKNRYHISSFIMRNMIIIDHCSSIATQYDLEI